MTYLVECSCPKRTQRIVFKEQLTLGRTRSCRFCCKHPNEIEVLPDGTIVIKLVGRDGTVRDCFIDAEDYPLVKDRRWHTVKAPYTYYAGSGVAGKNGILMHRLIRPDIPGEIDHKNHLGYDNQRANLRAATSSQNSANRVVRKRKSSTGYKGIQWREDAQKFVATISVRGKRRYLGYFEMADEAAHAYNSAAMKQFGEFAVLNQVPRRTEECVCQPS